MERRAKRIIKSGQAVCEILNYMSKESIIICTGCILLLCGTILGLMLISKFMPLLGDDSIVPNAIAILSSFTLREYLQILLSIVLILAGLLSFAICWVLRSKSQAKTISKSGWGNC